MILPLNFFLDTVLASTVPPRLARFIWYMLGSLSFLSALVSRIAQVPTKSLTHQDLEGSRSQKDDGKKRKRGTSDSDQSDSDARSQGSAGNYLANRQPDEARMNSQIKPKVLENIEKAQTRDQKNYKNKRAKTRVLNKNKNYKGEEIVSLSRGDMVTLQPKGRGAKIRAEPEIVKVKNIGIDGKPSQGLVELVDNSEPPQSWWEPVPNVDLFMRASEFPHMT